MIEHANALLEKETNTEEISFITNAITEVLKGVNIIISMKKTNEFLNLIYRKNIDFNQTISLFEVWKVIISLIDEIECKPKYKHKGKTVYNNIKNINNKIIKETFLEYEEPELMWDEMKNELNKYKDITKILIKK